MQPIDDRENQYNYEKKSWLLGNESNMTHIF